MGTWDVGPFDNDTAADFAGTLDHASPHERHTLIAAALREATGTTDYLDADLGQEAVAAAALVAAQHPEGTPAGPGTGPKHPLPDLTDLRPLAVQALDRVTTEPSELLDLWTESPTSPWPPTITSLRQTLLDPV
ncbi:DUF4259 domain-containing protein [Streptomyces reniochalinae]|uniref:DUF4259 domain-containing protein n=1 Tax=Streptomyces reniochalinae TaxID=2250578 RepID=A0A367ENK8_9ACTN|nr:DUF4259 domain-containing protein [Streptomyces reniochalinae]RCG19292.1 DUF4259 domain-containing protein [Streptomyces reniochalinae]